MEPFGLLNFLSTLFPQTEQAAKNGSAPDPTTETPTAPTPAEQAAAPLKQNPCAEFLEAHEKRARQTRR